MTIIETIKAHIETRLPKNWEYAHDFYVDEILDDTDFAEDMTMDEVADAIIASAIARERIAYEKALSAPFDAKGVTYDEDGARASDEVYTDEHAREIEAAREEAERYAEEYEREKEYMWYHRG